MSRFSYSTFILVYIGFVSCFQHNSVLEQSVSDESFILADIISNFFRKYFQDGKLVISIILRPSSRTQGYFEEDIFYHLFKDPAMNRFAHKILNKLVDIVSYGGDTLNLILINDARLLP